MSVTFESTMTEMPLTRFDRSLVLSVAWSYAGLRTRVRWVVGSNPDMGVIAVHVEMSTFCAPWIMYGPEETTSRPYPPPVGKHEATSCGIGAVAGSASR